MSYSVAEFRLPLVSAAPAEVLRTVATVVSKFWKNLENRREVRALAACDEHMLKDIGLTPSDVSAALDGSWGVDPSLHLTRVAAGRARHVQPF